MLVEMRASEDWLILATDSDWTTKVRWRIKEGAMVAQLYWQVPKVTVPGEYRITHIGYKPDGTLFRGVGETIIIK
jgi:hypothetical protein